MNQCNFIGNVGKDPEIKNGTMATFTLAVSEKYKDKEGNLKEQTEWINVVCFSKLTQVIEKYVHKGDKLFITGKYVTNSYTDKDGNKRQSVQFVLNAMEMLGSKPQQTNEQKVEMLAEAFDGVIEGNNDLPF